MTRAQRARQPEAQDGAPSPQGRRKALIRLVGSAVILTVLLVVLPLDELGAALARVPWWVWLLAVPGYLSLHLVGTLKWRTMVNAAGGGLRGRDAIRCYYYGLFGNTFLPSVVGGDVVRAGLALRLSRDPHGVVIGSVVDRTMDVLALAFVAGLGVLLLPRALDPQSRQVFWVLLGVMAVGGAVALAIVRLTPVRRFPYRVRRRLASVRRAVRSVRDRPGRVAMALALGVALQLLLVLLQAGLGVACGIEIALTTWLFAWPMAKLSALLPLTQGGLGVREAALAGLLAPFGVEAVLAVAAGLVFQGVIITGGLAGGAIAHLLGRRDRESGLRGRGAVPAA